MQPWCSPGMRGGFVQRGDMSTSPVPECKGMMAPVLLKWVRSTCHSVHRSMGPPRRTSHRELTQVCRTSARSGFGFARGGRLHRGEQECNAEVGRYPRRRWLFWNATRRLRIRNEKVQRRAASVDITLLTSAECRPSDATAFGDDPWACDPRNRNRGRSRTFPRFWGPFTFPAAATATILAAWRCQFPGPAPC